MDILSGVIDIELSYSEALDLIELLDFAKQKAKDTDPEIYEQAGFLQSELQKKL